jgi:hypothetical protein
MVKFILIFFSFSLNAQEASETPKLRDIKDFKLDYNWPVLWVISVIIIFALIYIVFKIIKKLNLKKGKKPVELNPDDQFELLRSSHSEGEFLDQARGLINQFYQRQFGENQEHLTDEEFSKYLKNKKQQSLEPYELLINEISQSRYKKEKNINRRENIISQFKKISEFKKVECNKED